MPTRRRRSPRPYLSIVLALAFLSSTAEAQEGSIIRVVPPGERREIPPRPQNAEPQAKDDEAEAEDDEPRTPRPDAAASPPARMVQDRAGVRRPSPPLLPSVQPRSETAGAAASPGEGRRPRVLPWVTLAGSAALAVLGAVFAVEASNALDDQGFTLEVEEGTVEVTDEFRDAQGRVLGNAVASTALLSAAAAGALLSLILLLEDA